MRFTVRSTEKYYEAKWWLDDEEGHIFRFVLDENTITAWRLAIQQLPNDLLPLLTGKQPFMECRFLYPLDNSEGYETALLERLTFCKLLLAVGREIKNFPALEILSEHAEMVKFAHQWPYDLFFKVTEGKVGTGRTEQEWAGILENKYQENSSDVAWVADLVSNYDMLQELAYLSKRQSPEKALQIGKNYAALVKGILSFLDITVQSSRTSSTVIRSYNTYSPRLRALLVENETLALDERRKELDLILGHPRMEYEKRRALLMKILHDLKDDIQDQPQNQDAMETIASLIAQYYLGRYDLDQAVTIWEKVNKERKDRILRILLLFYRFPPYYLVALLLALILLSFVPITASCVATMVLFTLFLILGLGLLAIIARFIKKQGFSYLELFLPRLLGSILVGLSILSLESTVWEITLNMAWGNWGVLTLASCIGSLAYLFLDIHKNTRLLSDELNSGEEQKIELTTTARSIRTTFRIFSIGLLEAFGFTTVISSLTPLNALGETFQLWMNSERTLINCAGIVLKMIPNNILIVELFGPNGLTLAYFPKLIVLWTGLSLLVGAFAQLLWQDRQITAS